jgi:hypothetical protein
MPLITQIQGNLRSYYLPGAEENCRELLLEMETESKDEFSKVPTCHPCKVAAQGAVARDESDELRRIADLTQPRNDLFAQPSGDKVTSVNASVGLHEMIEVIEDLAGWQNTTLQAIAGEDQAAAPEAERKWPAQLMPTHLTIATTVAVLGHLCWEVGWVLLTLGSDFRRWFHNFFYAPWTEWLVSMVWSPIEAWGKLPVHVRARVLDMGVTPASNICQWIAQYFIDQWYMLMDEYTKNMAFRTEPKFMAWEAARKMLSAQTGMNQHRPYAAW